jgi:hypothetical protein
MSTITDVNGVVWNVAQDPNSGNYYYVSTVTGKLEAIYISCFHDHISSIDIGLISDISILFVYLQVRVSGKHPKQLLKQLQQLHLGNRYE